MGIPYLSDFYVLGNAICDILIENKLIKEIKNQHSKKFPIECDINTDSDRIIRWNRLIINRDKRIGSQKVVYNLLNNKRIEPSTSLWCHPVFIVKNESDDMIFTADLKRLNNLVQLDEFGLPKV